MQKKQITKDKSVKNYIKKYSEKGLMNLIQEKLYRPESEMEKYATDFIKEIFLFV